MRSPTDQAGRPQSLSLYEFLEGGKPVGARGTPDSGLARGGDVDVDLLFTDAQLKEMQDKGQGWSTAGVEVFTSPQTLVNAGEMHGDWEGTLEVTDGSGNTMTMGGPRTAPIIDPLRPFLTLESISIDELPTYGWQSIKNAKVDLVLHDKSRLGEIADFVKPDLYGRTEFLIEYGWSHPHGGPESDNLFGQFLNALRCKEKYKIKTSSLSFEDDGSCKINLELVIKGATSLATTSITAGSGVEAMEQQIEDLLISIRDQISKFGGSAIKDVTGFQILNSMTDSTAAVIIPKKEIRKLRKFAATNSKNKSVQQLQQDILEIYGTGKGKNNDGLVGRLKQTISAKLKEKWELCTGKVFYGRSKDPENPATKKRNKNLTRAEPPSPDPFLRDVNFITANSRNPDVVRKGTKNPIYVSLGKIISVFLGEPLASSHQYDEVQLLFYPFNSKSGYMHDFNIAQMPINIEKFYRKIKKLTTTTANIPIGTFLDFINNNFINTQNAAAYGLSHTFSSFGTNKTSKTFNKGTALLDEKTKVLAAAYGGSAARGFCLPRITAQLECVPLDPRVIDPNEEVNRDSAILRIHIYDAQDSPWDAYRELLESNSEANFGIITARSAAVRNKPCEVSSVEFLEALGNALSAETGILEAIPAIAATNTNQIVIELQKRAAKLEEEAEGELLRFRIKGGISALKNYVRRGMPTISIGSQRSSITKAQLQSQADPRMASIMMLEGGPTGGLTAQGARDAGMPMRIVPSQLSLDTFGCPLFHFGQQFFVDFGTNTSVDNVYAVAGINHSLSAGEFKTSLKMRPLTAYGKYRVLGGVISNALKAIEDFAAEVD